MIDETTGFYKMKWIILIILVVLLVFMNAATTMNLVDMRQLVKTNQASIEELNRRTQECEAQVNDLQEEVKEQTDATTTPSPTAQARPVQRTTATPSPTPAREEPQKVEVRSEAKSESKSEQGSGDEGEEGLVDTVLKTIGL